ncbi:MAG: RpiB/LacA/LacB family sugar-phosphate isomerase [Lachnospiraceae bacterium]|nr:RpiB/LacA/LacB family sugar-phosphate isomerase [Lachnospiraceae bacterium]
MKTVKDKQVLVAADFAGVPLKDAVVEHLQQKGWTVTDIGVKSLDDPHPEMFHRIGLRVGAKITEGEFERALIFCGTGMGIHLAAARCPGAMVAVAETIPAALRAITGNNCNILAMGGHYIAPHTGIQMADAFLEHNLGDGHEEWEGFYEFHKLAYDELMAFDYEKFKADGFEFIDPVDPYLAPEPLEESWDLKYHCEK